MYLSMVIHDEASIITPKGIPHGKIGSTVVIKHGFVGWGMGLLEDWVVSLIPALNLHPIYYGGNDRQP